MVPAKATRRKKPAPAPYRKAPPKPAPAINRRRDAEDARCDNCGALMRAGERLVVREIYVVSNRRVELHCEMCAR